MWSMTVYKCVMNIIQVCYICIFMFGTLFMSNETRFYFSQSLLVNVIYTIHTMIALQFECTCVCAMMVFYVYGDNNNILTHTHSQWHIHTHSPSILNSVTALPPFTMLPERKKNIMCTHCVFSTYSLNRINTHITKWIQCKRDFIDAVERYLICSFQLNSLILLPLIIMW